MIPFALFLAAIPTPDPPVPFFEPPLVWVSYTNDSYPDQSHDDHRTAAFSGAGFVGRFGLSVDYQIGTDRSFAHGGSSGGHGQRADELAVAGWYRESWWSIGAGARLSEQLGGQSIQNAWHDIDSGQPVREPYEGRNWEPIVLGQVHSRKMFEVNTWDRIAIDYSCLVEGSTHGIRSEAKARLMYGKPPGALVLGGIVWLDRVTALSGTAAEIERNRGWVAGEMGIVADWFSVSFILTNTGFSWASLTLRY